MQRDWRDSKAGVVAWAVVFGLIMVPKPWLTAWQNVAVDAVLIPLLFWLIAPSARRIAGRGPKVIGIVLAGLLTVGLWGTGANAGTLSQAKTDYEVAKAKAPCLTAEQRSIVREKVALKSFVLAAENYAKRHRWVSADSRHWEPVDPLLSDPRLYEGEAYKAILHDAVLDYLAYARKVGRAILAHSVSPTGGPCYQAVVASLRGDGVAFENEDELSAYGPLELSQYDGGAPGSGGFPGGHGWGDSAGPASLSVDRNFDYGPGPACCFGFRDFVTMGNLTVGWAEVVLGIEILGLPGIVQGITTPPLDLVKLTSGLLAIGKGFADLKDAIERSREAGANP